MEIFIFGIRIRGNDSKKHEKLLVYRNIEENSFIDYDKKELFLQFASLEFIDIGVTGNDPTLREARADFGVSKIKSLNGMSGAPVYNITQNVLCGLAVRAGIESARATIHYIDIPDIEKALHAVHENKDNYGYSKEISVKERTILIR